MGMPNTLKDLGKLYLRNTDFYYLTKPPFPDNVNRFCIENEFAALEMEVTTILMIWCSM